MSDPRRRASARLRLKRRARMATPRAAYHRVMKSRTSILQVRSCPVGATKTTSLRFSAKSFRPALEGTKTASARPPFFLSNRFTTFWRSCGARRVGVEAHDERRYAHIGTGRSAPESRESRWPDRPSLSTTYLVAPVGLLARRPRAPNNGQHGNAHRQPRTRSRTLPDAERTRRRTALDRDERIWMKDGERHFLPSSNRAELASVGGPRRAALRR